MRALILSGVLLLGVACRTEIVELGPSDLGLSPSDSGLFDSGIFDSGVFDSGVIPDGGEADAAGADAESTDLGFDDTGVADSGVFDSGGSCSCYFPCSVSRDCNGIEPTSTCQLGFCTSSTPLGSCRSDSDCQARWTCAATGDPQTACN